MEIAGSRYLVTGGTGFIGSFVVERLVAEGADVVVFDATPQPANLSDLAGDVEIVEGDVRDAAAVAKASSTWPSSRSARRSSSRASGSK